MKIFPVTAKLFHTEGRTSGQTDRHEETNSRFSVILGTSLKVFRTNVVEKIKTHTLCSENQNTHFMFRKSKHTLYVQKIKTHTLCSENQNTHFMFRNAFPKIVCFIK